MASVATGRPRSHNEGITVNFIHRAPRCAALGLAADPGVGLVASSPRRQPREADCPTPILVGIRPRTARLGVVGRILILSLVVTAAAACTGSGQETESAARAPTTRTTTAATDAPTATPAVNVAADTAMARTLLLVSADFPTGWKSRAAEKGGVGMPDVASSIPHAVTANIHSPSFTLGDAEASSTAKIVKPGEDFTADGALLGNSQFATTLKNMLAKAVVKANPGAFLQSITVEPLQIARYGDFSIGYRTMRRLNVKGVTVNAYADSVWLGKGRIAVLANFVNADQPFDPPLQRVLLAKLGARLEAAGY
jgi:hypothetical protein